jgi:hypothetical protein
MKITVNKNELREAVSDYVDHVIYEAYSRTRLKRARVPKKSELVDQLVRDKTLAAAIEKAVEVYLNNEFILYYIYKEGGYHDRPSEKLIALIEKIENTED